MKLIRASLAVATLLSMTPIAYALPGIGPRVRVEGEILQVNITEDQRFEKKGGEIVLKEKNGQTIQVIIDEKAKIISEGRLSRKTAIPLDLRVGMSVRATGNRLGTDSMRSMLIIITNVEKNPLLSTNGVIQEVTDTSITILDPAGQPKIYMLDEDTEIHVDYEDRGASGLTFVGKKAFISLNRTNPDLVKVLRIKLAKSR